jgi:hypothetical protein
MRKLALAFAALLLSLAPLHAATRRHIVGRSGSDPVFGVFMNVAARPDTTEIGRTLDLAQADGIGLVRIPFTWSTIQPSNASNGNFLLYYPIVARANAINLRIVGVLGFSTPWNTTAPSSETRAAQREHYPPADFDTWYGYVLTTVSVFKDSVHYWEVWSSPDVGFTPAEGQTCNGSWCGTSAQYAQLLSVAYRAVKTADPSASVVVGGLSLGADSNTNFLYDILTDPNFPTRDAFDIMSFHAYGSKTEALRRMNFVKSQMLFGGAGARPTWVTEFGYPSDPALQTVPPYFNGESGQAAYLKDLAAYLLLIGARKIFWYQMFDTAGDSSGLLTTDLTKKLAYNAYGDFISSYHP